jgi:hypothetical protein
MVIYAHFQFLKIGTNFKHTHTHTWLFHLIYLYLKSCSPSCCSKYWKLWFNSCHIHWTHQNTSMRNFVIHHSWSSWILTKLYGYKITLFTICCINYNYTNFFKRILV